MQLLLFAASTRTGSSNQKLIMLADQIIQLDRLAQTDLATFSEFEMPLYDADKQAATGLPKNALYFIDRLKKSDGLIIASPEYNFSVPGTLKNLIDWVSRATPMPWGNYPILLLSASPSVIGGNRGLWATRIPLEACGAYVFPRMFSLGLSYQAFTADNQLKDTNSHTLLKTYIIDFIQYAKQLKPIPLATD